MASRDEHMIIGGTVGFGIYVIYKVFKKEELTLGESVVSIITGMSTSIFPDILEPAFKNPNHRQFFHSIAFLVILASCHNKLGDADIQKLLPNILIGSYASHLVRDFFTRKGLPLV